MEPALAMRATYYVAAGTLLMALAGFLAFTSGGGPARRALALAVGFAGTSTFASAYSLARADWTGALGATGDFALLGAIALGCFYALYPRRPQRSALALLSWACVGFVVIALIAWLAARPWFLDVPDMRRTPQWHWLGPFGEGIGLAALILTLIAVLRAAQLPEGERRGAAVLLSGLALPAWLAPGVILSGWTISKLNGLPYVPGVFTGLPGDPLRLTAGLWLVSWILGPIALAAVATFLLRTRLPLVFLAIGIVMGVLGSLTTLEITWVGAVVTVAIVPFAQVRYGALGGREPPPWASGVLAAAVGVGAFLLVSALVLSFGPANPVLLVFGVLGGAIAAGAGVLFTLPRARALASLTGRGPESTRGRLEPYRLLLEQEVASGTSREALVGKLRGARASLGVSEHEHAVLEYALLDSSKAGKALVAPGRRFLDRYRIEKEIGKGGAGVTYRCHDERLARDVVIKTLRGANAGPESLAAVVAEARSMGRVRDVHVVNVLDVEQIGEEAFIVMEHLDGGSLADRLARGPLSLAEFRRVADGVLLALDAVHDAGLVHRDVKPSNVLLTARGGAKLGDFGIAHLPGFETTAAANAGSAAVAGTIPYMSPEQARGRGVGHRSDLFSAAATLYEAWTGERYLAADMGESAVELQLRAASAGPFDRPWHGPPAMRPFWQRALHPVASGRFGSAREMREALDNSLLGAG